jgi:hypothetical protein
MKSHKSHLFRIALVAALASGWQAAASGCDAACRADSADARAATAKYHEVGVATADGYFSTVECVQVPGLGAMGIHYVNPPLGFGTAVDAARPEALLYIPEANGTLRLAGVEYTAPVLSNGAPWFAPSPPPAIDNPAPVLFGQVFDGPMPGHGPGQPWHYDLHVWIWQHNPAGMFAPFNPRLACGGD